MDTKISKYNVTLREKQIYHNNMSRLTRLLRELADFFYIDVTRNNISVYKFSVNYSTLDDFKMYKLIFVSCPDTLPMYSSSVS